MIALASSSLSTRMWRTLYSLVPIEPLNCSYCCCSCASVIGFLFTSSSNSARTSTACLAISICAAMSGFLSRPRLAAACARTARSTSSSRTACLRSSVSGWPWEVSSRFLASMRDGGIVTPFTTPFPEAEAAAAADFFEAFSALSCAPAATAKVPATRATARLRRVRCMEFPLLCVNVKNSFGRGRLDLEGMDVALHEVAQRLINHSVPGHGAFSAEGFRNDGEPPVAAAGSGARVARMLLAFVAQIHRDRLQRAQALADDLCGRAHYAHARLRQPVVTTAPAPRRRARPASTPQTPRPTQERNPPSGRSPLPT